MKKTLISLFLLLSVLLSACSAAQPGGLPGYQPTATLGAAPVNAVATAQAQATQMIATAQAEATKQADPPTMPTATQMPTAMPTATLQPTTAPANAGLTSSNVTIACDGNTLQVPTNGQVFESTTWVNNQPQHNPCYDTVYDPNQSGVNYLPAKGWWYQPLLPGPHKAYFETALVLQAGTYKYVGPECTVYLNTAGNDSTAGKNGKVIVNRQNIEKLVVDHTAGAPGTEAWVFVVCNESDAGGFSFALR
jgi:hypothetical protein